MSQCIIYARCSTKKQAWGHSIQRQLDYCTKQARQDGAYIRSIYIDICSGADPSKLVQRHLAEVEALQSQYPIYVEALDRWTRCADDPSLCHVDLVECMPEAQQLHEKSESMLRHHKLA